MFCKKTEENVALKNEHFLMIHESEKCYGLYFNESASPVDVILSIKNAVTFCAAKEKNNPYYISFRTESTECLNQLFFAHIDKMKLLSLSEADESDTELDSRYVVFLQNLLSDKGCNLNGFAFITTPDMECIIADDEKPRLHGEVSIYFNWHNIANSAAE